MEHLLELLLSFVLLTFLELILAIDNVLAIIIAADKVSEEKKAIFRSSATIIAAASRILLLCGVNWLCHLYTPLFNIGSIKVTVSSFVLLVGGIYLMFFSASKLLAYCKKTKVPVKKGGYTATLKAFIFIFFIDIVFSLDSVFTAIAVSGNLLVMVIAILLGTVVLCININRVSNFIENHPAIKILALVLLLLISLSLIGEAFGFKISKFNLILAMVTAAITQFISLRNKNIENQ